MMVTLGDLVKIIRKSALEGGAHGWMKFPG